MDEKIMDSSPKRTLVVQNTERCLDVTEDRAVRPRGYLSLLHTRANALARPRAGQIRGACFEGASQQLARELQRSCFHTALDRLLIRDTNT